MKKKVKLLLDFNFKIVLNSNYLKIKLISDKKKLYKNL